MHHKVLLTNWCELRCCGTTFFSEALQLYIQQIPACCPKGWKIIYIGICFTTSANVTTPNVEALPLFWYLQYCWIFIEWYNNMIITVDDKTLLGILSNCELTGTETFDLNTWKKNYLDAHFILANDNSGKWDRGSDGLSNNRANENRNCIE